MYFLLILFFGSLVGITFMIGRKLVSVQNGHVAHTDIRVDFLKAEHVDEIKKTVKHHGYKGLVALIRFYVKSVNLLKTKFGEITAKTKEMYHHKFSHGEKKEVSKFLKMMSDYKEKIREITHRITEEENNQ